MIGFGQGTQIGKSSSRALEVPRHDINSCIKRIDKDMIGFGRETQIGKSSSRAPEAPMHEINTCVKRIDKEMTGFGQGTQIGKSSSRALDAPRYEINTFIRELIRKCWVLDKELRLGPYSNILTTIHKRIIFLFKSLINLLLDGFSSHGLIFHYSDHLHTPITFLSNPLCSPSD